jgi:hypothetical protein
MQKNKWSRKFDWIKSGTTYIQQTRSEQYNENRFIAVGDIYFKLNKYLTGVTFTYINNLSDIYKRDLLTGDGYSILAMYNEYDVIDRVMKNIVFVDVSSNSNININQQWFSIDGIKLKPGHLVLLSEQNSEFENDIYQVTPQYFLKNSGLLSTREKSDRFSCSVKMGTNADKQFFLINNGFDFPVTFEPKYFIEGKSFILKNLIKYNLYNTSTNSAITSKIIFTDYDFARRQLAENYNLYSPTLINVVTTDIPTQTFFSMNHHHDSYTVRTGITNTMYYTGVTSDIKIVYKYNTMCGTSLTLPATGTLYLTGGTKLSYISGQEILVFKDNTNYFTATIISYDKITGYFVLSVINSVGSGVHSPWSIRLNGDVVEEEKMLFFYSNLFDVKLNDYLNINIYSGSSVILSMNTYVKNLNNNNRIIILQEIIPIRILNELKGTTYRIDNLSISDSWNDAIYKLSNYTPYTDFYTISAITNTPFISINIKPKESKFDKYFDYNDLKFNFYDNLNVRYFNTNNQYIKYNLFDRLYQIDPSSSGFTYDWKFFNESGITNLSYNYTDKGRIRITTSENNITEIFKPYTYVYAFSGLTGDKTLIYEVNDHEIIIEEPNSWDIKLSPSVLKIQNIDGLQNISDILYEVYFNVDYDWYIQRTDNERKYITRAYGELLTQNKFFRSKATGILYENENNEFVLKLYDLETDRNLYFSTIELVFIGADRKTRLPVPLKMIDSTKKATDGPTINLDWNVLDGGYDDPLYMEDVFDSGLDVVLPGPNNPPLLYNIIDGN